ncbi:MAG: hypothetical protein ACO2O0_02845 [Desulfurococcales archaeon]
MISLLYLGVEKPREAMMPRAPETEALYEGSAQKGFGDPRVDGSPMPLGSTATYEPIEIPRSLWGRWKSPDATGMLLHPCGSRSKTIQNKLIPVTINNHRGTSG